MSTIQAVRGRPEHRDAAAPPGALTPVPRTIGGRWGDARALLTEVALSDEYSEFLTLPAYERMP